MTNASISSRQASELLDVHESSVKRWCNSGELECWLTPGGHRRIPISALVDFAGEREIGAPIADFGRDAERVWIGLESAGKGDYSLLSRLLFEWLELQRSEMIERLFLFLLDDGLAPGRIFDGVLAGAMRRVGAGYQTREISIGDEHRMTQSARDALIGVKRLMVEANVDDADVPLAVVGCARSEAHEMGALVVRIILTHHGWRVLYLGADVPTEEFHIQRVKHGAALVCVSMSPMKGETTALEIIQLMDMLATDEVPFRMAVGGAGLADRKVESSGGALLESRLFQTATSFEEWLSGLDGGRPAAATAEP